MVQNCLPLYILPTIFSKSLSPSTNSCCNSFLSSILREGVSHPTQIFQCPFFSEIFCMEVFVLIKFPLFCFNTHRISFFGCVLTARWISSNFTPTLKFVLPFTSDQHLNYIHSNHHIDTCCNLIYYVHLVFYLKSCTVNFTSLVPLHFLSTILTLLFPTSTYQFLPAQLIVQLVLMRMLSPLWSTVT